jgi:glutamate-ammonia-ligase adenylyltransferase
MRVCSVTTGEGSIWPVDAALRPEGKDGPLVRTLASHEAYYRRWARTWEFQALLKARPVAGDRALGEAYCARIAPLVWRAADREHFVDEVQSMRRRVEAHLPLRERERELKLGPGGLRDIEFAVQLLQLVHGRGDETLRSGSTLVALESLAAGGYVGRGDAATLAESYRWLRTVEHRLQLQRLRRTHRVPDTPDGIRWLAASLGYRQAGRDAVAAFEADRARHAREVRRLHEKLFYRPLLQAVARVPTEELRLAPEQARARLEVLGFADPAGAMRHLEALTTGVSRKAAIQRALLPAMLGTFASAPDPDAGLLAYRQVSEALGATPWFLRFLRDEGQVAERLALLLGSSRYVADLLGRAPETLRLLADDEELRPRPAAALRGAMLAASRRAADQDGAIRTVRALRRQELVRISAADLLGLLEAEAVGVALSDLMAAVLEAALDSATRCVADRRGRALPARLAIVAMGRLGGSEVGYSSDADVLFVHEPLPDAEEGDAAGAAKEVAEELRRMLSAPGPDPGIGVDAALRPEGRQGALSRSLSSYAAYYANWASVWEAQALLRARPVAGDEEIGRRFVELADTYRYPASGLSTSDITEIRRIKARVDSERLPRGADPATHVKLGRGGLTDVEWTVQLLQLSHGHRVPALRTTGTLSALRAAAANGLLSP